MTITVEDGSIVAGANSFVSIAEADSFFETRLETLWTETASDEAKERALILAALYMRQAWRFRWMGSLVDATQRMDWPRRGVPLKDFFDPFYTNIQVPFEFQNTYYIGEDTVPQEIKDGQCLLALATLDSSGESTTVLQDNIGRLTKKEKAGSLEVEYMTAEEAGTTPTQMTEYWEAEQLVSIYFNASKPHTGTIMRS